MLDDGSRTARRPSTFDVGLTVVFLAFAVIEDLFFPLGIFEETASRDPDLLGYVLLLLAIVPMTWRRTNPISVLIVNGTGFFGRLLVGYSVVNAVQWSALVAIYGVGAYARRPEATYTRAIAFGLSAVGFVGSSLLGRFPAFVNLIMFIVWLAAGFLGETVYARRQYQDALEERARRLEEEQEEKARRAIIDERARIARDLHDVWAHSVSLIVVQAGAAEEVFDTRPEAARQALVTIREAGRRALDEVRRMLAVDDDGGSLRGPVPTIADLEELVDEFRQAGLPVDLERSGTFDGLPEDASLTVYRIIQQALTNALSHGGTGVTASVSLTRDGEGVTLLVEDDGLGADAADSNHEGRGLIGMRERVAPFGGTLSAGPVSGGGFRVEARLPIEATR